MAEPTLPPARYETEDVTVRFLLIGAGGLLAVLLLCMFGVMLLYPGVQRDHRLPSKLPDVPTPRLQASPRDELQRFEAQEMARLNGTGWVDKANGIVHIPIDRAMQEIARKGIPEWPAQQSGKP